MLCSFIQQACPKCLTDESLVTCHKRQPGGHIMWRTQALGDSQVSFITVPFILPFSIFFSLSSLFLLLLEQFHLSFRSQLKYILFFITSLHLLVLLSYHFLNQITNTFVEIKNRAFIFFEIHV